MNYYLISNKKNRTFSHSNRIDAIIDQISNHRHVTVSLGIIQQCCGLHQESIVFILRFFKSIPILFYQNIIRIVHHHFIHIHERWILRILQTINTTLKWVWNFKMDLCKFSLYLKESKSRSVALRTKCCFALRLMFKSTISKIFNAFNDLDSAFGH